MFTRSRIAVTIALFATALAGCGNWPDQGGNALWLIDASRDRAVLEYAANWSGWMIMPSSIWVAPLPAGDASRFKEARVQADLQADGDYYVAERPTDDGSRIVAGRFSTGDEWTLLRRDVRLEGRIFREVVLDGDRAAYRTPDGLSVYSLTQREILQTVPLSEPAVELLAVGGRYALISLDDRYSRYALVDLEDGTSDEPPTAPDGLHAMYYDAALSNAALITAAYREGGDGGASYAILILDLPARTWRVLADYGASPGGLTTSRTLAVLGADQNVVLVSVIGLLGAQSLELIDRATGERSAITAPLPSSPGCALLRAGQVYWVEQTPGVIRAFDVATRQISTYPADPPLTPLR